MSKNIKKEFDSNFEKIKIGFLLELGFRQNFIKNQLKDFICFLDDNESFLNVIDLSSLKSAIENYGDAFLNFTDLIFLDVDFDESHCMYHKDFY